MIEKIVKLAGVRDAQLEIAGLELGEKVHVIDDPDRFGAYLVLNDRHDEIGRLTDRNAVSQLLYDGAVVLAATVNSIGERDDQLIPAIRFVIGAEGETYTPDPPAGRTYKVNIVGESYRQAEIGRTTAGEPVKLMHDAANAFDPRAIAAVNAQNEVIGYLPRDGWLTGVLLDERRQFAARVLAIHPAASDRRFSAVVLEVVLSPPATTKHPNTAASFTVDVRDLLK